MLLSNGKDTIELTDEIQIRAYLASGYKEVQKPPTKKPPTKKAGAKNGTDKK